MQTSVSEPSLSLSSEAWGERGRGEVGLVVEGTTSSRAVQKLNVTLKICASVYKGAKRCRRGVSSQPTWVMLYVSTPKAHEFTDEPLVKGFAVLVLGRLQSLFSSTEFFLCGCIFFPDMICYSLYIINNKKNNNFPLIGCYSSSVQIHPLHSCGWKGAERSTLATIRQNTQEITHVHWVKLCDIHAADTGDKQHLLKKAEQSNAEAGLHI